MYADCKKLREVVSLSHWSQSRQEQRTERMFASEDCKSARHQDRVSELGGEANGPSRRAYIFNWRISSMRVAYEPVCSITSSCASDNIRRRNFRNFFARSNAAGYGTSFGPGRKGGTTIVRPAVVGRLSISD